MDFGADDMWRVEAAGTFDDDPAAGIGCSSRRGIVMAARRADEVAARVAAAAREADMPVDFVLAAAPFPYRFDAFGGKRLPFRRSCAAKCRGERDGECGCDDVAEERRVLDRQERAADGFDADVAKGGQGARHSADEKPPQERRLAVEERVEKDAERVNVGSRRG